MIRVVTNPENLNIGVYLEREEDIEEQVSIESNGSPDNTARRQVSGRISRRTDRLVDLMGEFRTEEAVFY